MSKNDTQITEKSPAQEGAPELDEQTLDNTTGAGAAVSRLGRRLASCVSSLPICTKEPRTPLLRSYSTGSIPVPTTSNGSDVKKSPVVSEHDVRAIGDIYQQAFCKKLVPGKRIYDGV